MARKNVEKVFKAWLNGREARGPKGTIWTDGVTIYSYRMPICVRTSLTRATISEDSPSVTTSIHRNQVRYLCSMHDVTAHMTTDHMVKTLADATRQAFMVEAERPAWARPAA